MKKIIMVALSLVLCLAITAAWAETIQLELTMLENGLTFPTPVGWMDMGLEESDYEEGFILMLADEETGRSMLLLTEQAGETTSNADLADLFAEDEDYTGAKLTTNDHGHQMVLYALQDQSMIGYCFMDTEGWMYNFAFFNANDEKISGDSALLQMVDDCMADTYFDEDAVWLEEDEADYETETIPSESGVALTMAAIQDGPVFPLPAQWAEVPLTNEELDSGCIAAYKEEESGRTMLIVAKELGKITTAELAEGLADDEGFATVRLMTNDYGQDLVLFVVEDLSYGGYSLMDDDGWTYQFLFSLGGGTVMTDDAVLAQLVQDCMANTYFED